MSLFSDTELLIMIIVVSLLILFITILTIIDIKERIKIKNEYEEFEYDFNDFSDVVVSETVNDNNLVLESIANDKSTVIEDNIDDELFSVEEEIFEYDIVKKEDNNCDVIVNEVSNEDSVNEIDSEDNIIYSSIEVTKEEAINEINKLSLSLENDYNAKIMEYENKEEEDAIISLHEFDKLNDTLYEMNELKQYDDGNEPISIDEVMNLFNKKEDVSKDVFVEDSVYEKQSLTPFISSIYGIEKNNDMEFENTANYEKLDRNNRDFLDKLKDVHKELGN